MGPGRSIAETLASAAASFRGERIGRYQILAQLSLGGMAELFLAFASGPGGFRKYVVVKRILPDVRSNDQFVQMFLDEARITAAFNHPHIAHVFDLGEEDDGLYLAMEFIAGQNLNQVMEACVLRRSPPPLGFTGRVARDVALALHYAHTFTDPRGRSLPVIHRDVAQKNVMVGYDGGVKLLDFGIAKARGSLGRTVAGTVKGTTGYMSPEQVLGREIDGRSDVFSLGVVMHELLTGRRLFAGDTEEEEMRKILTQPIPRPAKVSPSVPEEVSDLVMRALAREKADRFPDAKELARAIETVLGKTVFDQERASAFMKELFEEKVLATQALIESAETDRPGPIVEQALMALRRNDGMMFEGSRLPISLVSTEAQASPPPALEPASAPKQRARRTMRPFWIAAAGVLAATLSVGAYAIRDVSGSKRLEQGDPSGGMRPLASAQLLARAGEASPPEVAASVDPPPAANEAAEPSKRPSPHPMGKLTLLTRPACDVYLGKQHLGKTPLFNQMLSAGVHTLELKGPDRKRRRLSVVIRAGETSAMRISLADLPVR